MPSIAIHYMQHCQTMLERADDRELAHCFFHLNNIIKNGYLSPGYSYIHKVYNNLFAKQKLSINNIRIIFCLVMC